MIHPLPLTMYKVKRFIDLLTPGTISDLAEYPQIVIDKMVKHGQVEPVEAPQPAPEPEPVDLSSFTVAELKDMASAAGIVGYSTMRKAELIEALTNGDQ